MLLVDPLVGTAKLTGAAQIGGQHAGREGRRATL